ncbi:methylmalonyl Co-A mutase-associated GTPase MeaB [Bacillus sp. PS06]|uniref:methylmalonyl Co-A mutase-associated GTPase MeaB n=1 Tax=Bacillus sp. PS06 TaxID=2764176 RepID=UPI0017802219|nr:methylmalonyl Co-A mutase-associated GTPase MeaB [Bacillus sp. PS06]MBD8070375.1 methylmalonyl Co-A mutase-associated GTPase MeaB [Bacillus sp. PS06]
MDKDHFHFESHQPTRKRKNLSKSELVEGVINGDRAILARAITLVESDAVKHKQKAQEVINELLPHTGNSVRIGITGVPGAGKSTFIESMGQYLCNEGHRVAVLAVDPSSQVTGGSILGDKTRMEILSRDPRAFVRPSPSGGTLGGVSRKTRETILLCEAAGFDIILIETIGVGQSEVVVRNMVDFFLLLTLTGAGDELQAMKKGVVEITDAIVIHKADNDNKQRALMEMEEYNQILHYMKPMTPGWTVRAFTASSLLGEGIADLKKVIDQFVEGTKNSGFFEERRKTQLKDWVYSMIREELEQRFFSNSIVQTELPRLEHEVFQGRIIASSAVDEIFKIYEEDKKK